MKNLITMSEICNIKKERFEIEEEANLNLIEYLEQNPNANPVHYLQLQY